MKYLFVAMLSLFCIQSFAGDNSVYAEVVAIEAADTSTVPAVTPTTVPAVTTNTAVTTTVSTQSTWSYIVANVFEVIDPILKAALMTLASCVLVVVAKHFNIQVTAAQQQIVANAAQIGVAKAEAWADAHKDTPSSNAKLNYAVNAVKTIAGTDIVKNYTNDQLSHYVEHAVYTLFNQTDPNTVTTTTVVTEPKPIV